MVDESSIKNRCVLTVAQCILMLGKESAKVSEKSQIVFMQVRLLRLAAEKWNISVQRANELFDKYGILQYIEDCFGIFHTEGDYAVFDDIQMLLRNKGVDIFAEIT